MNRWRKILTGLFVFGLSFSVCAVEGRAAEQTEPYTYKITFHAGNQGVFRDVKKVSLLQASKDATAVLSADGTKITVENLEAGDIVTLEDLQLEDEKSAVKQEESSPYYVQGIRKSGRDNDALENVAITVKRDQDYVVAYGIRGDMVAYEVRYQDTDGNTLFPSQTYHGNVGDRPVVAFRYIEGYEPQAYNLTGELDKNEALNIFTFTYSRVAAGGGAGETIVENVVVPGNPADAGAAVVEGGGAPADEGGTPGDEGGAAPEDITGEEVPLEGPAERIDLDDEEVPLAGRILDLEDGAKNMLGAIVVGVTALAALLVMILVLMKQKKEKEKKAR